MLVSSRARLCTQVWKTPEVVLSDCSALLSKAINDGTRKRAVKQSVKFSRVGDGNYGSAVDGSQIT